MSYGNKEYQVNAIGQLENQFPNYWQKMPVIKFVYSKAQQVAAKL